MSLLTPEEATAIFNLRSHEKPNEQTIGFISSVKYVFIRQIEKYKFISNFNLSNITKLPKKKTYFMRTLFQLMIYHA